jgi:hypothetical protein
VARRGPPEPALARAPSALDELVVAPDAAVRREDQELKPDARHLAVVGDHLPSELDHVGEALEVVSPPEACNAPLIRRLKRKSRDDADEALGALIDEVEAYLPAEPPDGAATEPVVSMELRTPLGEVSLFTIIATLGAPLEVTAANLAIETFLPADADSAARLRDLAEQADHTAAPTP